MTTWTLSGFADEIHDDPLVQTSVLQALGARFIEVRSAWGTNVLDWTDAQARDFADHLRSQSMQVSALASPVGKVPADVPPEREVIRLRRAFELAAILGTRNIRIFSFFTNDPESSRDAVMLRMAVLAREAERAGMQLLHENEKGIYGDTPARILDIIETVGSPALRVAWDSANFVQVGIRPYSDGYRMLAPHIAYLQVKDAMADTGDVVPAGEGDGELLPTLVMLREDGYDGFVSLEPHLPSPGPGFPGAQAFGRAARALRRLTDRLGVVLV